MGTECHVRPGRQVEHPGEAAALLSGVYWSLSTRIGTSQRWHPAHPPQELRCLFHHEPQSSWWDLRLGWQTTPPQPHNATSYGEPVIVVKLSLKAGF
eukprot:SM000278S10023  [mRNA]  locus=s278:72418:73114:+ [translate_table: standard]